MYHAGCEFLTPLAQKDKHFSPRCTYEDWVWASLVFQTRGFPTTNPDGTIGSLLVPFGDMLNHQPGPKSSGMTAAGNVFFLAANQDFEVGDEVTISYGPRSNLQLLYQYGFIIEDNPDE
jgi:hypothetical protein